MNVKSIFTLSAILISSLFYTQQVTKSDTINGTPLNITMDSRTASAIEKMESNCNRGNRNTMENEGGIDGGRPQKILVPSRALTTEEICRKNPRISGFKIQIAVVKSNAEANEIKTAFRKHFPRLKVETDASLRPNYKILAGSYFSKASASSDLSQIKAYFKDAVTVQKMIFCVEGK